MTNQEAIKLLHPDTTAEAIREAEYLGGFNKDVAIDKINEACILACEALEKTSDRNCSQCIDNRDCAIFDNFHIDYCSDWRKSYHE